MPFNDFSYIITFTFYTQADVLRNTIKSLKCHLLFSNILRSKTFKREKDK